MDSKLGAWHHWEYDVNRYHARVAGGSDELKSSARGEFSDECLCYHRYRLE